MSELSKFQYDLAEIRAKIDESGDNSRHAILSLFDGLERMAVEIKGELSAIRQAIEAK